ncbi:MULTISPECIES: ABC transporter ATP-binding protein [Paenibacillus]|uniref:ABC transporter ATP-binding protein n=1 Tax=Paenibacillus TaxID=44249 RepID=UPI00191628C6|nr:ABC transporter ATP-binding protein [Paenibacillus sp. EPM92]
MRNVESISVENITKVYKLYEKQNDRFKESLNPFRKKYHKEFYALDKVSFSINKGEIIGIIGKNGSGKSTILKIITGVLSPTSGSVQVNGNISALLELGAGFNTEYTGIENIYLNGMMLGYTREEMDQKIGKILEFADIGDFVYQPVKSYSSGMFARLAFSVAINVDPEILIVDEALAVGDLKFQLKCMDKFNEFRDQGKTILFVSHDINSIKRYCNRVIWINEGKLIAQGNTETICDRYTDYLKFGEVKQEREEMFSSETASSTDLILQPDIIGYIDSVKILSNQREELSEINFGANVTIQVDFFMNQDDLDLVIGVAIHTIDNIYVCGLNTLLDKVKVEYTKGGNTIYLNYKNINLLGGSYYFDVAIFESNAHIPIDYKAKVKEFFVSAPYVGEGLYIMPHEWTMKGTGK